MQIFFYFFYSVILFSKKFFCQIW